VGELALMTYLQDQGLRQTAGSAVLLARFQHGEIVYNAAKAALSPGDLAGRRVGVRTCTRTTGVWMRGFLQHQYGVDLDRVTWVCTDDPHLAEYHDPAIVERAPSGYDFGAPLLEGRIDAAILGKDLPKNPDIRSLIRPRGGGAGVAHRESDHSHQPVHSGTDAAITRTGNQKMSFPISRRTLICGAAAMGIAPPFAAHAQGSPGKGLLERLRAAKSVRVGLVNQPPLCLS
jgi:hypothetical protein